MTWTIVIAASAAALTLSAYLLAFAWFEGAA